MNFLNSCLLEGIIVNRIINENMAIVELISKRFYTKNNEEGKIKALIFEWEKRMVIEFNI